MNFDFAQFRAEAASLLDAKSIKARGELAKTCGVTRQRINQWLRNESNPSLNLTLGICKTLGMDVWRYFK